MSEPDTPTALALRRLQVSRGHLVKALSSDEQSGNSALPGMAWAALRMWWQQQPLAASAKALARELQAVAGPLVRRHPLAAVLAATLVGGALAALRPWRLLRTQVGPWLFAHATSPTVLATMAALAAQWMTQAAAQAPAAAAADVPASDGMSESSDMASASATMEAGRSAAYADGSANH
jgi:hypothetical protein